MQGIQTTANTILTGADRLLALVNERHEISITAAAKCLNLDNSIIAEWADMLKEAGLIEAHFTLSDKVLVSKDHLRFNKIKTIVKHALTERGNNSHELDRKRKELQNVILELDAKIATLKHVQVQKMELEASRVVLKNHEKELETSRKRLEEEQKEFQLHRQELHSELKKMLHKEVDMKARETSVKEREERVHKAEIFLQDRADVLERDQQRLASKHRKLEKIAARLRALAQH